MLFEIIIPYLIFIHAGFGGIALVAGSLALITTKGSLVHKKSGRVFFLTMLISALVAIVISLCPGHFNSMLLSIGVFSTYLIVTGYRAISYKNKINFKWDTTLSYFMIITALSMMTIPYLGLAEKLTPINSPQIFHNRTRAAF